MAANRDLVAAFSSRGSTTDNHIRPGVVAPGTFIVSANSGHNGHPEDPQDDSEWAYMSGTSMAAPLVAGCCAVLREAAIRNQIANPSAALTKAATSTGTVPLGTVSPNNESGFGRVNLAQSIDVVCKRNGADFRLDKFRNAPDKHTYTIDLQAPTKLRVTLVWSERSGDNLQNRLSLAVEAADGSLRVGGIVDQRDGYDTHNNVQQVRWDNMPSGETKLLSRRADPGLGTAEARAASFH